MSAMSDLDVQRQEKAHEATREEWEHAFTDVANSHSVDLHSDDVKPEPAWASALVVQDKDGDHWGHDGENRWTCLSYDDPLPPDIFTTAELSTYGPITIVIASNGRNVKADRYREYIDGHIRKPAEPEGMVDVRANRFWAGGGTE